MTIDWNVVTTEHVQKAVVKYNAGNKPTRDARNTFLKINDRLYPAKHIRGLAYELATGTCLDPSRDYAGGKETALHLRRLGFQVIYNGKDDAPRSSVSKPDSSDGLSVMTKQPSRPKAPRNTDGLKNSETGRIEKGVVLGETTLRLALVVHERRSGGRMNECPELPTLRKMIQADQIDIVVFPESFEGVTDATTERILAVAKRWGKALGIPVLMGVTERYGFVTAAYYNPAPHHGETREHLYVKHSSAFSLAYDWDGYKGEQDPMFSPIRLKGARLAVQICHDMFFGLIGHISRKREATAYIDLTGGNVNLRKWHNVVRARSIELDAPFLCTMGYRPDRSGASESFAYIDGSPLLPVYEKCNANKVGIRVFHTVGASALASESTQAYSEQSYNDILVALGTVARSADVSVTLSGKSPKIFGKSSTRGCAGWHGFKTKCGSLGVLLLPHSALHDGLKLYKELPPEGAFDNYLVVYHAKQSPDNMAETLSLMVMKAIEHRVAVGLFAGNTTELIKTNNYKNVQRFRPHGGVFGLNAACLGGTRSAASNREHVGIPKCSFDAYLSLYKDLDR